MNSKLSKMLALRLLTKRWKIHQQRHLVVSHPQRHFKVALNNRNFPLRFISSGWTPNSIERQSRSAGPIVRRKLGRLPSPQIFGTSEGLTGQLSNVCDPDNLISFDSIIRLEGLIEKCTVPLGVVIIRRIDTRYISDHGDTIHDASVTFANETHDRWRHGSPASGILLVITTEDKFMYLSIGNDVPTSFDARAVDSVIANMRPHFKSEEWANGIEEGISKIMSKLGTAGVAPAPAIAAAPLSSGTNSTHIGIGMAHHSTDPQNSRQDQPHHASHHDPYHASHQRHHHQHEREHNQSGSGSGWRFVNMGSRWTAAAVATVIILAALGSNSPRAIREQTIRRKKEEATALESIERGEHDHLVCPKCLKKMTFTWHGFLGTFRTEDPKSLDDVPPDRPFLAPCGHPFCKDCIVQNTNKANGASVFLCPVCHDAANVDSTPRPYKPLSATNGEPPADIKLCTIGLDQTEHLEYLKRHSSKRQEGEAARFHKLFADAKSLLSPEVLAEMEDAVRCGGVEEACAVAKKRKGENLREVAELEEEAKREKREEKERRRLEKPQEAQEHQTWSSDHHEHSTRGTVHTHHHHHYSDSPSTSSSSSSAATSSTSSDSSHSRGGGGSWGNHDTSSSTGRRGGGGSF